jgi:hypothetical protein
MDKIVFPILCGSNPEMNNDECTICGTGVCRSGSQISNNTDVQTNPKAVVLKPVCADCAVVMYESVVKGRQLLRERGTDIFNQF